MKVYTREEALANKETLLNLVKKGAIFIYPTDTIYGIGCDATNSSSVKHIRALKQREEKPFSVIAPSKKWITTHCAIPEIQVLEKLPGPYTLIAELKDKKGICNEVNYGLTTLGVRIPAHWISEFIAELGRPLVTTSVNLSGKPNAATLEELKEFDVDFIIFEGSKTGKPSTLINTVTGDIKER